MSMYSACIHFDLGFDLLHGRDGMFALEVKVKDFTSKNLVGRHTQKAVLSGMWSMGHWHLTSY
jgi:uncharacterized protein (DUF779 family)